MVSRDRRMPVSGLVGNNGGFGLEDYSSRLAPHSCVAIDSGGDGRGDDQSPSWTRFTHDHAKRLRPPFLEHG